MYFKHEELKILYNTLEDLEKCIKDFKKTRKELIQKGYKLPIELSTIDIERSIVELMEKIELYEEKFNNRSKNENRTITTI